MKRLLTILALAGLVSCSKLEPMQMVSFGYQVESGAMTKAEVGASISALAPTDFALSLRSLRSKEVYQSSISGSLVLPVGKYAVSGSNKLVSEGFIRGNVSCISKTPKVAVNEEIEVVQGKDVYTLNGTFKSFAVAFDLNEIGKVSYYDANVNEVELPMVVQGTTGIAFVTGEFTDYPLRLKVYPKSLKDHEPVTIKMYTGVSSDGVLVAPGNYYLIHPKRVETSAMTLNVTLPDWVGNELNK